MSWMLLERMLVWCFFSCDAKICAMHVNCREEHDVGDDDGYYGSCCSARFSIIVEDMDN